MTYEMMQRERRHEDDDYFDGEIVMLRRSRRSWQTIGWASAVIMWATIVLAAVGWL